MQPLATGGGYFARCLPITRKQMQCEIFDISDGKVAMTSDIENLSHLKFQKRQRRFLGRVMRFFWCWMGGFYWDFHWANLDYLQLSPP